MGSIPIFYLFLKNMSHRINWGPLSQSPFHNANSNSSFDIKVGYKRRFPRASLFRNITALLLAVTFLPLCPEAYMWLPP